ncbi:signal transduction histidine kinase LytS [Galbibacter marinus]|uniref:Signal transduction histidine kinase LytS n=2 Tax=Galbibacter marinus TaxID=555500 RepID=K2QIJ2_9FLAO|nr:signal transduction histidine kinase LytS [Galbibacter marinus]
MSSSKHFSLKNLLIFFLSTLTYALCQMLFSSILLKENVWSNLDVQILAHYLVVITLCMADFRLVMFLNKHLPFAKNIFLRVFAELIGLVLICLVLLWVFNFMIYDVLLVPETGLPSFLIKFAFFMITNIPILLVFELIYYFQSEQKAIADSEKAKREVLSFQHDTLRAQMNPHFLFNSLNVLSSLIYLNPENANKFTKALSKTYRYVLSLNRQPLVTVEQELDALDSYLFMMKMRFENSFILELHKTPELEQNKIIPLTLQLLIENVFKHNIATEEFPLHITIDNGEKYLTVENNIQRSNSVERGGIGLKYLSKQYELYSRTVKVEQTNETFKVRITYI